MFIVCQTTQCIILIVKWFYLWRNKVPLVLLSAKVKKVAKKFHKNLNLGNQFHKDAIKVAYQIDETLKELKMNYPKIFEGLKRIL